jgi:hypothetical protein
LVISTQARLFGQIRQRPAAWSRLALAGATYALVVGAASAALALPDAIDGEAAAAVRVVLGLLGTLAGLILWTQPRYELLGWRLATLWALAQIPVIAWNEDGSATRQLLEIPLSVSSRTTVNGEVTSATEYGINLVAIALVAIYVKLQRQTLAR